MEIAKLKVDGVYVGVVMRGTVTAGLAGATIGVEYAAGIWEGLTKTVVFRGATTKDFVTNDTTIKIPWEVLTKPNERLQVGFFGVDDDKKQIIPTIWADLGIIQPGTDPSGDPSTDPSLPVWGQIADRVEGIAQDVEELKQGGGPGTPGVPGADGEDGGYYIPELSQPDEDTIQFTFTPSKEDMPAVEPVTVELPVGQGAGGNVDLTGYATEQYVKDYAQPKGNYLTKVPDGYAKTSEIPKKPEDIGALPNTYTPPNQTAEQVGADPKGTAASAVSQHNTSDDSHNDIRLELKAINDRLTAFFDSDNQTLDELSEIVAYITSNKALIDSITTSKVSVADIINNLTTNVTNKPLSATQGVVLKGLIDAVSNSLANYQPKGDYALRSELPTVPTKVSAFTNDAGYLTQHQDISHKLDSNKLPEAVNDALAQAKASGEFDGKDGTSVTVKSVSESTADGGSNVVTFSDGKTLTVKNGKNGTIPVKGTDYFTSSDKTEMVNAVIQQLPKYNGGVS